MTTRTTTSGLADSRYMCRAAAWRHEEQRRHASRVWPLRGDNEKPRALRSMRCEVTRSGVGSSHPAHHEWRPADFGRVRKARWDAVEANCRTLEGMARPAGSAGAQVAAAAGAGRGDIGSGLSRQQAGSLAFGGLRARLEKHQALIALLRRLAPLPIAAGFVIAPRLCEPRGRSDCAPLQSTHLRLNPDFRRWTTSGSAAGDDGCVTVLLLRGKQSTPPRRTQSAPSRRKH
jgi:hypothetical protein